MSMEFFGILLCFCSGAYGVVITNVSSRTEIPANCNLAAPSLSINGTVVKPTWDTAFDSQSPSPSGVWVNYTNDYVYLQIMGCIDKKDASVINKSFQDPFNCSFLCKAEGYIGFTRKDGMITCLCLTFNITSVNTTQSMCNICSNDELLCGTSGYAAVYSQVLKHNLIAHLATAQETTQGEANCLSNHGGKLEWRNCAIASPFPACMLNCSTGKSVEPINITRYFWSDAVRRCLEYNRCPARFSDYLIRNLNKDIGWWIGVIRVRAKTRQYGYLSRDGDFYLHFTSNASQFQWALCNGLIIDTHQNSTQTSAETTTSTVTNSGTNVFLDPTPSSAKENVNTSNSVGLYVGISVAVVVLIVSVTSGFCFWRRRKGHPMKDNRNGNQFPSGSTAMTNKAYSCEDETFAHIKDGKGLAKTQHNPSDIADTTNDPHYFVLERKRNSYSSSNRNSTVKSNDNEHYNCIEDPEPYSGAIENEIEDVTDNYHTIPHSESKSQPSSLSDNYDRINPTLGYDISNSNDTGMYNHAPKGNTSGNPKPVTGQRDDYDRLCLKGAPNTINNYDKLGMNRNAIDTSTYSRIDDKTTVHSDYDRINQVMSSGKDDTYDHIRRQNVAFNEDNNHTDHDNGGTGYDTVSNVPKTYHNEECGHYSHVPSG